MRLFGVEMGRLSHTEADIAGKVPGSFLALDDDGEVLGEVILGAHDEGELVLRGRRLRVDGLVEVAVYAREGDEGLIVEVGAYLLSQLGGQAFKMEAEGRGWRAGCGHPRQCR